MHANRIFCSLTVQLFLLFTLCLQQERHREGSSATPALVAGAPGQVKLRDIMRGFFPGNTLCKKTQSDQEKGELKQFSKTGTEEISAGVMMESCSLRARCSFALGRPISECYQVKKSHPSLLLLDFTSISSDFL